MTETKTFKNVRKSYMDSKEFLDAWYVEAEGKCAYFKFDEWDMEVTFTKKVREPKVGDKVLSPSGISTCEVAAIDGDEVWLRYSSDGSHSTIDKDKLIYAR